MVELAEVLAGLADMAGEVVAHKGEGNMGRSASREGCAVEEGKYGDESGDDDGCSLWW